MHLTQDTEVHPHHLDISGDTWALKSTNQVSILKSSPRVFAPGYRSVPQGLLPRATKEREAEKIIQAVGGRDLFLGPRAPAG